MVSWGQNTVHTISAGAPSPAAGFSFGASAPAPTAPGGFGAPAPASGSGLFGSTSPAAPAAGGLFGSSSPAVGGGLFGATAAAAPAPSTGFGGFGLPSSQPPSGGGLFGAPAPAAGGLFGSPAPAPGGLFGAAPAQSPYGAPQQQQQQQYQQQQQQYQQQPAQAALQAHLDASVRQEQERVTAAMTKLKTAYTGQEPAVEPKSGHFSTVLYNPLTPVMRQQQWLHGMGVDGHAHPIAPPKPPQISDKDWSQAVVRNPDWQQYMPVPVVGAEALQARLTSQQEQSNVMVQQVSCIVQSQELVRRRCTGVQQQLDRVHYQQATQRKRLMAVMRKVELVRCLNHSLQPDEVMAQTRLKELVAGVDQLSAVLATMADRTRQQPVTQQRPLMLEADGSSSGGGSGSSGGSGGQLPDKKQLMQVLKEHRDELSSLTVKVEQDRKDLKLVQQRVDSVAGPPRT